MTEVLPTADEAALIEATIKELLDQIKRAEVEALKAQSRAFLVKLQTD